MLIKRLFLLAALCGTTTLAACGGGGAAGSSVTPAAGGGTTTQTVQSQTEDAVNTADAIGSPVKDFGSYNETTNSPLQSEGRQVQSISIKSAGSGACNNGVEFWAPDKKGDANSTERIEFYDNACTAPARDAVRIFTSTGTNSENVSRTVSLYALNSTTPEAVRSETVNYTNATFDQFGYPVYKNGFDRTHTGELDIANVKTIVGDGEIVVQPTTGNVSNFCSDSAGFNATGDASLNETFGWAGVMPNGTRTVNSDGSVTWNTNRTGTAYTGAIGGLSIQTGPHNTACPISTPMFSLAGGTAKGSYSIPVTATYNHGILTNLTIANATLANGETLNVQTNSGVQPGDSHFISGTLAKNGSNVATFNVNAFGDGVMIIAASGKQYQMEDWHVVK